MISRHVALRASRPFTFTHDPDPTLPYYSPTPRCACTVRWITHTHSSHSSITSTTIFCIHGYPALDPSFVDLSSLRFIIPVSFLPSPLWSIICILIHPYHCYGCPRSMIEGCSFTPTVSPTLSIESSGDRVVSHASCRFCVSLPVLLYFVVPFVQTRRPVYSALSDHDYHRG